MREIKTASYSSAEYTDENMLLNFGLSEPALLNRSLTHLWGKDSNLFPLLTLTEGNDAIRRVPRTLNNADTQYKWRVASRMKFTSPIVRLASAPDLTKPGYRYQTFEIEMLDNLLIYQWGAKSPDGNHMLRIQSEGRPTGLGTYIYTLVLTGGNPDEFVELSNFEEGKYWSLSAPTVSQSKSDGNRSNSMSFGEATNQYSIHRFSKQIAGNIANKVVDIELEDSNGNKTNAWLPYEMKMFELARKQMLEDHLWDSEYNRDENGVIHLTDPDTHEVIPHGNGVKATLKSVGNYETYAKLSLHTIKSTVEAVWSNRVDDTAMEIVLYCGKGFMNEFDLAIERDAEFKNYFNALGENKIQDMGAYLSYGKYFRQFVTSDDKVITFKHVRNFDYGTDAQRDLKNGYTYKGLPVSSYQAFSLDQSVTNDGERNIELVCEEGREFIVGVYKGMSPIPVEWSRYVNIKDNKLGTTKDIATYEVMSTQGISFRNPLTSFWLALEL